MSVKLINKKILITGATGQVALPVVEAFAKHNEVFALARFSNPDDESNLIQLGAKPLKADLASDDLTQIIHQDIDYVLNFAVLKTGDFDYDLAANAEGVGRLLVACQSVTAFIHFSSTAVYQYAGAEPRKESSPLGDNHRHMFPTYSISKIAAETVARFTAKQFDIPLTIARLSVPYGDNGGWPFWHLLMMKEGIPIDVHPDAPNTYNLLHTDDYIEKIPALLEVATTATTTLNFGGSDPCSIEQWCEYITELTGFLPIYNSTETAFGSLQIDTTAMHKSIGKTKVDWKQGVLSMIKNLAPELLKP
ncbi:MAG: UDP-glucuronate 4-epimerase [Flavobacteriales bacterium]|jgi:UDP-glucuronate 4-epimerase